MGQDKWDANLYDSSHSFVSRYGTDLIELLEPKKDEHILDIGCGTGDLANEVTQLGAKVLGIDNSGNMIQQAKAKYPDINFRVEDILQMEYKQEFDAVLSNAALHWVKSPKQALQGIYASLKDSGRFVAEFGGKGNVQKITDEIIRQFNIVGVEYNPETFPWYFPSIGEYTSLMEDVGFRVTFAHHFDRPTPLKGDEGLRDWLEMFTSGLFEDKSNWTKERIFLNTEEKLRDILYRDGKWIADYKRIRVVGVKE